MQPLLHVPQPALLAFQHLLHGNPCPFRHHGGDIFLGHFLAQERPRSLRRLELFVLGRQPLFQLGQTPEAQLGSAVEVTLALGELGLGLGAVNLALQLLNLADELLLPLPDQLHGRRSLAQLGDFRRHLG